MTEDAYKISAGELLQFIERWEHLEAERKEIVAQQKEVMAEAKGRGYDPKAMRKVISARQKTPDQRAEEDAVFGMYAEAVGL